MFEKNGFFTNKNRGIHGIIMEYTWDDNAYGLIILDDYYWMVNGWLLDDNDYWINIINGWLMDDQYWA